MQGREARSLGERRAPGGAAHSISLSSPGDDLADHADGLVQRVGKELAEHIVAGDGLHKVKGWRQEGR